MNLDGTQVVVNKITKKLYYVEGFELRLICELLSSGVMQWTSDVIQSVQDACAALMTGRQRSRRSSHVSQVSLPSLRDGMESLALAEEGIYQEIHIMDSLRVHAKNYRINLIARLITLLGEFSMMT